MNKNEAFDLLNKLNFVRQAGTAEELVAANILKGEVESVGTYAELMPFEIPDGEVYKAEFEILEPYNKKYTVTGYKCAKNTEDDGIIADFVYAENLTEANLSDVKGKIVLFNGYLRLAAYRKLLKSGAAAIVSFSGSMLNTREENDLFTRAFRETLLAFGNLPAIHMDVNDAFEIVKNKATKAKLTLKGVSTKQTSHNVIATIEGTKYKDDFICIGAHFDSTEFSHGVYDNAAGSVIIMELLKYYTKNPPLRTLKFAWFGAEEVGLLGSKHYAKETDLKNCIFMINVDVGASVMGSNLCHVTGSKELTAFIEMYCNTTGIAMEVKQEIYSSDSIPFADNDIPSINLMRSGAEGTSFIHTRHDVMDYLSVDGLDALLQPTFKVSDLLINAVSFPEKREMPTEMKEKVDKYLFKKELKELEEKDKKDEA